MKYLIMTYDLNNQHKIKHIPPATNPTDLLMKQTLDIHDIFI